MLKLNKKTIRIISIILLAVMMLMTLGGTVFADSVLPGVEPTLDKAQVGNNGAKLANTILSTLMWIGVAIAIGMMIFLGIKYVTASPDGKADLKKQLGIYILGFVLIVGATTIVGVINSAIQNGLK